MLKRPGLECSTNGSLGYWHPLAKGLSKPPYKPADAVEAVHVIVHAIRHRTSPALHSHRLVVAQEVISSLHPPCRYHRCGTIGVITPYGTLVRYPVDSSPKKSEGPSWRINYYDKWVTFSHLTNQTWWFRKPFLDIVNCDSCRFPAPSLGYCITHRNKARMSHYYIL